MELMKSHLGCHGGLLELGFYSCMEVLRAQIYSPNLLFLFHNMKMKKFQEYVMQYITKTQSNINQQRQLQQETLHLIIDNYRRKHNHNFKNFKNVLLKSNHQPNTHKT